MLARLANCLTFLVEDLLQRSHERLIPPLCRAGRPVRQRARKLLPTHRRLHAPATSSHDIFRVCPHVDRRKIGRWSTILSRITCC